MGSALCTMFEQKPVKVLFHGLQGAGKTTLLYKLKLGEVVLTVPTLGYNVEELKINGTRAIMWDVGIGDKMRPFLRHYIANSDAIVWVIDSKDRDRLSEAVEDFFQFVYEAVQERQLPVLVLANKQDQAGVLSPEEIESAIYKEGGEALCANTALEVFPAVALTLEGVNPALEWLTSQLALKIAHESYFPSFSWSAATQYPASFVKSAFRRVAGLFSAEGEKKEETEAVAEK